MKATRWRLATLSLLALVLSPLASLSADQILTIDTSQVSFLTPTVSDFDAGHVEKLAATTLTVASDVDWKLTVSGTATLFSCTGASCWSAKPRGDIDWRKAGGSYQSLSGTATTVTMGLATTPGTEDVTMDYRVQLDWTQDAPGDYDYNSVQFVLSAL